MFNKKLKQQQAKERAGRMSEIQKAIDAALKTEDAGKRYDALAALSAALAAKKEANDKIRNSGDLAAVSLIASAVPAGLGAGYLFSSLFVFDLALTGGVLTAGSMLGIGFYTGSKHDAAQKQKAAVSADYDIFLKQIGQHQLSILENTEPELLLSSQKAMRQLSDNPGFKNKFIEAARLKDADKDRNPPPPADKNPDFKI